MTAGRKLDSFLFFFEVGIADDIMKKTEEISWLLLK